MNNLYTLYTREVFCDILAFAPGAFLTQSTDWSHMMMKTLSLVTLDLSLLVSSHYLGVPPHLLCMFPLVCKQGFIKLAGQWVYLSSTEIFSLFSIILL